MMVPVIFASLPLDDMENVTGFAGALSCASVAVVDLTDVDWGCFCLHYTLPEAE